MAKEDPRVSPELLYQTTVILKCTVDMLQTINTVLRNTVRDAVMESSSCESLQSLVAGGFGLRL